MPQAAELFKISPSPSSSSEVGSRRLLKPQGGSTASASRFGDVLNRASQQTARKEAKPAPERDAQSDTKADEPADAKTSATRGRAKADKASKAKTAKRKIDADDAAPVDADPSCAEGDKDAVATEPATDNADTGAEDSDRVASHDDKSETPSDDSDQTNPLAIAPQQAPQQLTDSAAAVTGSDEEAGDSAPQAITSDSSESAQKLMVKSPVQATQQSAEDSVAEPEGDSAHASAATASALGTQATARPAATRQQATPDEKPADAARATSENVAAKGADALAPTGSFEQLASMIGDADGDVAEPKSPQAKDVMAAPDMTRFVAPDQVKSPHESAVQAPPAPAAADPTPEARFSADNHEKIVSGVRGELLPNGGTMKLRLDPPELGTMQVSLHLKDGVVSASFQTANGDAAQLLSHTLGDLRSTLEAHGIVVDKLHVQQSPREDSDSNAGQHDSRSREQSYEQQQDARREQQRKDMIQRMWDRLAGLAPIDLVA